MLVDAIRVKVRLYPREVKRRTATLPWDILLDAPGQGQQAAAGLAGSPVVLPWGAERCDPGCGSTPTKSAFRKYMPSSLATGTDPRTTFRHVHVVDKARRLQSNSFR